MLSHLAPSIIVIDSNPTTRKTTSNSLERSGFNVVKMSHSDEVLIMLNNATEYNKPHVSVISTMPEGLSQMEICKMLRNSKSFSNLPILVLVDNAEVVSSQERNFDEYLIKPFGHDDLITKVKLLLSRAKPVLKAKVLRFQDIEIDLSSFKVVKNGIEVHLGPTEFKILQCLLENPTKIFSRQDIMNYVWQTKDNVEARTIDVHINRLRTALRHPYDNKNMAAIKTVRSAGYCLELQVS